MTGHKPWSENHDKGDEWPKTLVTYEDGKLPGKPVAVPLSEAERLQRQVDYFKDAADLHFADAERFRNALVQIADAESGIWGTIARKALNSQEEGPLSTWNTELGKKP